jgi:hypothetical protein
VGFEPTIPAFERAKTVHVLGREATAIGKKTSPVIKKKHTELELSVVISRE